VTSFETPREWKSGNWWRNRSLEERVYHAKVPARHAIATRAVSPTWKDPSIAAVDKWVASYTPGKSLLIQGYALTGKTFQAVNVLTALMENHKVSGRFIDTDDYVAMVKDSFDSSEGLPEMYSSQHLLKYIKGTWDILVIDGLGQERLTDFAKHEIGSLIRHRHAHMLTTIITSEHSAADIRHIYTSRMEGPTKDMDMVTLRGR